ncbi:hypothetical protein ZEAMMB73_Zm00001d003143 [Zea mays]|uniref:Uncharacterized protein n=1 Tax=Zea mays TaxID=4577 RepID=A0A1D6E6Z4_MAIZE|nr:hypothetical protein ZEAMMB73_Zm00001d003143 [Zea mays]ONM16215.1 hypothetical protein ZEAMMB73_Zm00001d003143 [Zea mays]ONM16216.1 hypothetical protein ZEAMMB73_Zm00001d003143 [Zea mays]
MICLCCAGFCRDRDSGYLTPLIQNDSTESLLRWQCQPVSHRNYRTTREIQIRRFQGSARYSRVASPSPRRLLQPQTTFHLISIYTDGGD